MIRVEQSGKKADAVVSSRLELENEAHLGQAGRGDDWDSSARIARPGWLRGVMDLACDLIDVAGSRFDGAQGREAGSQP